MALLRVSFPFYSEGREDSEAGEEGSGQDMGGGDCEEKRRGRDKRDEKVDSDEME